MADFGREFHVASIMQLPQFWCLFVVSDKWTKHCKNKHAFKFITLVSVKKVELTKLCFSHSRPLGEGEHVPRFFTGIRRMGFVYDTIFANADFWSSVVQMYGLCYKPYNKLRIFHLLTFKAFCFPSVRFLFMPLVL